jgi:hypothetical protein
MRIETPSEYPKVECSLGVFVFLGFWILPILLPYWRLHVSVRSTLLFLIRVVQ